MGESDFICIGDKTEMLCRWTFDMFPIFYGSQELESKHRTCMIDKGSELLKTLSVG